MTGFVKKIGALVGMLVWQTVLAKQLVHNAIPKGVECTPEKLCFGDICNIVCQTGSVVIDPWLKQTLQFQIDLAKLQSFCWAQWPSSHNSAISMANGYGNEDFILTDLLRKFTDLGDLRSNNQWLSLTDQLNMGVRMLELDTHWVKGELRIAHCGTTFGGKMKWLDALMSDLDKLEKELHLNMTDFDEETIGCDPALGLPVRAQRSLASAFAEIKDWLMREENKSEFLLIFFDDQMDLESWGRVPELVSTIHQYFGPANGDLVFTPADFLANNRSWPVVNDMVGRGKRLVFTSGADYQPYDQQSVFYKFGPDMCDWKEPGLKYFEPFPACQAQVTANNCTCYAKAWNCTDLDRQQCKKWMVPSSRGQVLRPETDALMYGLYLPSKYALTAKTIPSMLQCNVNFISPDSVTPALMKSFVWSWAEGHPLSSSPSSSVSSPSSSPSSFLPSPSSSSSSSPILEEVYCNAIQAADGRWYSLPCSTILPAACLAKGAGLHTTNGVNQWQLSQVPSSGQANQVRCPAETAFAAAFTALAYAQLASTLQQQGAVYAWIAVPTTDKQTKPSTATAASSY